jgi:LacI family transcriptional regulator
LNLSIPEDVAVMGFDNQKTIAAELYPPLSTMELPHYEMGVWAVHNLIDQMDRPGNEEPVQHMIACPLIERESA